MFGAELYNANNERFFSSQFKTYVYKGWLYPYYIQRMAFSTPGTNNGISNTVARTHYIVPAGNYTSLVAFGTSYNNRPCLPFAVTPNPEGRTGLCNTSTATSYTASSFTINTNLFYDIGGLPDAREQVFRQHMNVAGTDTSYLEVSALVLNVGDVVWSSDNPSNKVTVTGISFSGGASGLQYPTITLSGSITLNAAVSTNDYYSCICAEKFVNTVYICAVNFGVCGSGQSGNFNQTACKPETYPLRLFDVLSSNQATGFGMQMFDETGNPTFDSNQSILEIAATVRPTAQSYSSVSARPIFNITSGSIPTNWAVTGSVMGVVVQALLERTRTTHSAPILAISIKPSRLSRSPQLKCSFRRQLAFMDSRSPRTRKPT